ncbi:MAG: class I SAM-dependent rRNA methyltransferase [Solobacterium sp.]|nr:class I SAM-dependent rRNA methyltransferase [Solobacterium sp.]
MKQKRHFSKLTITKKEEKRIQFGHPWIYEDEIIESDFIENGNLVDVFSEKGKYLGTGLYSSLSKIKVRILDHNANETFEEGFFRRRVQYAIQYRVEVMPSLECVRLIHGEADGLPGVTVDLYHDILVTEILSYGMDLRKKWVYEALIDELKKHGIHIRGLYERNEGNLRIKEGLEQNKGWYLDLPQLKKCEPIICIKENGILFEVDIENGQKTGFFLDQKMNRLCVQELARNKNVLDICTHTGSFAINAAVGGARKVTALDVSEYAIQVAKENAIRNDVEEKIDFVVGDAFEFLEEEIANHHKYDFVILDPPAFTKSRKTIASALKGYQRLNMLGMKAVKRGGYLATCSCSHFVNQEMFENMLLKASKEANVSLRLIEVKHASYDHPSLLSIPETDYLKFFLMQVI